jgi:cell division septation protein DedD
MQQGRGVVRPAEDLDTDDELTAGREDAPLQPVVEIEERDPTEGEKLEMKLREAEERAAAGPQNGAELHATETEGGDQPRSETASGDMVVISGSYVKRENAERQVAKLEAKGFTPFITEIDSSGVTYHRVNVGSFAEREAADELVERLREEGFVAGVVTR